MAHRNVEIVVGRLITDESFRATFLENPILTLARFVESGYDLTRVEIAALEATDGAVWAGAADAIDPRLAKAALNRGSPRRL